MNLEMLRSNGLIEYESVVGSHAYGTNISTSDVDTAGVFVYPSEVYLGLNEPIERIGDEKSDTVFYALRRFIQLLKTANPTLLELLWMPDDCVKTCSPRIRKLIENRSLFVSKKYSTPIRVTHGHKLRRQRERTSGSIIKNQKSHQSEKIFVGSLEEEVWILKLLVVLFLINKLLPMKDTRWRCVTYRL